VGKLCWLLVPAQTSIHVNPKIGVKRGTRKELPDDESGLLSLMFKSELFDNIYTEITKSLFQVNKKMWVVELVAILARLECPTHR